MTKQEAVTILNIDHNATAEQVRRKYEQLYSDYQIRLTNAPTPSLKKVYQTNLQELQEAVRVLNGSSEFTQADLPAVEPSYWAEKAQEKTIEADRGAEPLSKPVISGHQRRWPVTILAAGSTLGLVVIIVAYIIIPIARLVLNTQEIWNAENDADNMLEAIAEQEEQYASAHPDRGYACNFKPLANPDGTMYWGGSPLGWRVVSDLDRLHLIAYRFLISCPDASGSFHDQYSAVARPGVLNVLGSGVCAEYVNKEDLPADESSRLAPGYRGLRKIGKCKGNGHVYQVWNSRPETPPRTKTKVPAR
jgi:hypothetical protein